MTRLYDKTASRFSLPVSRSLLLASRFTPFLGLLALVLIFFNKMAFSNLILARGDTFLYFYPYWQAAAAALRNGRIPLWNPDLFMGAPFLANSQAGFFYPLNWPVWLLLPTPYAVSASILVHLIIAGWGTYLAARRVLLLSRSGAFLTAVLFALGGYLTAQVEHINQLQGLAWLPWFFVAVGGLKTARLKTARLETTRLETARLETARLETTRLETTRLETGDWGLMLCRGTAVALLFSLQLLAGHTQTAFITGVGVLIFVAASGKWRATRSPLPAPRSPHPAFCFLLRAFPLLSGALLAVLLTAVQLLPTLELARHSSRQGGLAFNEVLSFSLHPLLLGRSLLPAYGQSLFSEYAAFLPLAALILAVIGAWQWRRQPAVRPFLVMTILAFLLALGRFTPLYWLLARLPGFDLFRVPARWLALYALGMAMLAGVGGEAMRRDWRLESGDWGGGRPFRWGIILLILLIGWSFLAVPLARFIPLGPETPAAWPAWTTILGWAIELTVLALAGRVKWMQRRLLPLVLVLVSLFLASRTLPYNNLTTPEAYFDWRPPIARIKMDTSVPPGRLLSLSNIFFDPGDQGEIDAIYADQLSEAARYDYTIAIKQKEIIAPNLPMAYGVSSVDGFDGGILPISSYSELMQLILPNQVKTVDGRLREHLMAGSKAAVPEPQWLDLFNTQYLITDKTGDTWQAIDSEQDVFFDLQHPVTLAPGTEKRVGYVPQFLATGLVFIAGGEVGTVQISTANEVWELVPQVVSDDLWRVSWPEAAVVEAISLAASASGEWGIKGLSLINEDDQTSQSLVLGQYRLLHSGDVKIYENMDVLPRAFLVQNWQWQPDVAAAVGAMREPGLELRETAVLLGSGEDSHSPKAAGQAVIVRYAPEQVVIQVESDSQAVLVLTDAFYPGWTAVVDGQTTTIYQMDVLFRAIMIPAGWHEVIFTFTPRSYENGRLLSLFGLVITLLVLVAGIKRIRMKHRRV